MCEETSHMWGMFTLPSPFMPCMPLSCLSPSHESQVDSHMCEKACFSHLLHLLIMSPSKVAHTCVSIFPPLNGQNPNPCGAYLASTSLILRDPNPPSSIRSQSSVASLISYKRRAPLLIFTRTSSLVLCCRNGEQPHSIFDEIINYLMVSWGLHLYFDFIYALMLFSCCLIFHILRCA